MDMLPVRCKDARSNLQVILSVHKHGFKAPSFSTMGMHCLSVTLSNSLYKGLVGEKPLVIFSRSSCCMCHSVKQLITSYGASFTAYELDQIPNGQEIEKALQEIGSKPTVPAVFIGQKFIGGAKEVFSMQVQGKLTPLLKDAGAIWI